MKTLNLNKLILLTGLFLISIVFSTGSFASCKYDSGILDVNLETNNTRFMMLQIAGMPMLVQIHRMSMR